jgi:hypothetical protein
VADDNEDVSTAHEDNLDKEISDEQSDDVSDSTPVTVWSPDNQQDGDEVLSESVEEWIASVEFESTADVPIPERLVD